MRPFHQAMHCKALLAKLSPLCVLCVGMLSAGCRDVIDWAIVVVNVQCCAPNQSLLVLLALCKKLEVVHSHLNYIAFFLLRIHAYCDLK